MSLQCVFRTFCCSVAIIFFSSKSSAATVYVDSQIGSTTCLTYNPATRSCTGGLNVAFRTIALATTAAIPGTEIVIRAGVYAEQLRPASGLPGLPVTYRAFTGESVRVGGG